VREAGLHSIEEYMKYAKEFFTLRSSAARNITQSLNKTIYLASDEPEVFIDAKLK
jgi:hypothetical protein